ncbi:hypothetical protein BR93DRAFT_931304 [Coniochaeta sp. PMI_546]|nr:hypothetical protein BR93DRAFT_931304 [Coniochaeta sp. PMI_546]
MSSSTKRKEAPTGSSGGQGKRNKRGGNDNKWKTSHQQTKEGLLEGVVSPGEMGIWVSCARSQEGKAAREIVAMFDEYAEILYGVKQPGEEDAAQDDEEEDIEASVKRELDAMKATGKEAKAAGRIFTPVKMNVACLLFVRTRAPVEPVEFVKRICQDAKSGEQRTRSRYVNRLVPMTAIGKATEQGLVELARKVLGELFDLSGKRTGDDATTDGTQEHEDTGLAEAKNVEIGEVNSDGPEAPRPYSFAIRPSIRNNNTLKREVIINQVAGLINNQRHKVDLEKPDKVILVEVYQNACGMSIVDGDYWNELKKYNLTELYSQANNQGREEQKPSALAEKEQ